MSRWMPMIASRAQVSGESWVKFIIFHWFKGKLLPAAAGSPGALELPRCVHMSKHPMLPWTSSVM